MKAVVYRSTGSWYQVKTEDGSFYNARMKGVFKLADITSTNPIAVGDNIRISLEDTQEKTAVIEEIFPRKNHINRQSPRQKHHQHIIAANVDQSILIATIKNPKTSLGFMDRFLIVCEMYHVPAVLVFNKTDLLKPKDDAQLAEVKALYESIGYKTYSISVEKKLGLHPFDDVLKNKISLLSGHSGVGKSTLINYILPNVQIKTQNVSDWSGKGMHTTTFATMYDLPNGGAIIDTPGIRELAINNLEKEELSHYFPEMRKVLNQCKYNNCLHTNEPDCAVKNAVSNEQISVERYASYLSILDSLDEIKKY